MEREQEDKAVLVPLCDDALLPSLEESFNPDLESYRCDPLFELDSEERAALAAAHFSSSPGVSTQERMQSLLSKVVAPRQMNWAVQDALQRMDTRFLEPSLSRRLALRERELNGRPVSPGQTLDVQVSIRIDSITIPDPARDELLLHCRLYSCCHRDSLLGYLAETRLVTEERGLDLARRWSHADFLIGTTPEEREALEKTLGVRIVGTVDEQPPYVSYNFGNETMKIWREADTLVRVSARLDLRAYPFDESDLLFRIRSVTAADPTGILLVGDPYPAPLLHPDQAHPRGFQLTWLTKEVLPVAFWEGPDSYPHPEVVFKFRLVRNPGFAVWRTFVPVLIVELLAMVASISCLASENRFIDSVMNQVLPAILIACVALQWTAAQLVPPHSGRTLMDEFFVYVYAQVLLLYLTLVAASSCLEWPLLAMAVGVLLAGIFDCLSRARRSRRGGRLRTT